MDLEGHMEMVAAHHMAGMAGTSAAGGRRVVCHVDRAVVIAQKLAKRTEECGSFPH